MKAAEREERNARALALFVGGATYKQIAATIGLRSTSAAHTIVQQALAASAQRRALLSDEALAIHQERQERLLLAHWTRALGGRGENGEVVEPDHRSAEIVRRILAQQAKLYGLDAEPAPLPAPTGKLAPSDPDEEGELDDLAKQRARRSPNAG